MKKQELLKDYFTAFYETIKDDFNIYLSVMYNHQILLVEKGEKQPFPRMYEPVHERDVFITQACGNRYVTVSDNPDFALHFFINYYNNHSAQHKLLLQNFKRLVSTPLTKCHETLFEQIAPGHDDLMFTISALSNKAFSVDGKEELEAFNEYFKLKLTPEEDKALWLKILKGNTDLLSKATNVSVVKSFLLNKYNHDEDELKTFFGLVPSLQQEFTKVSAHDLKAALKSAPYQFVAVSIDMDKIIDTIQTDKLSFRDIEGLISDFITLYVETYNIEHHHVFHEGNICKVFFAYLPQERHDDAHEVFQEQFANFLVYCRDNAERKIPQAQDIQAWIDHERLTRIMSSNKGGIKKTKL